MGHRKSSKTHANSLRTRLESQRGCNSSLELSACSPSSPPLRSRSRARSSAAHPMYARRGPFCSSRRPSSIRGSSSPDDDLEAQLARHRGFLRTMARLTGVVKSYKTDKGFGFLVPDDGSGDVFTHFSYIVAGTSSGGEKFTVGDRVEFDLEMVDGKRQGKACASSARRPRHRHRVASPRAPSRSAAPRRRAPPPPYDRRDERRPGDAEYRGREGSQRRRLRPAAAAAAAARRPASIRRCASPPPRWADGAPSIELVDAAADARARRQRPAEADGAHQGRRRLAAERDGRVGATRASSHRRRRRRAPTAATSSRTPGSSRWRRAIRPPRARPAGLAVAMATTTATARRRPTTTMASARRLANDEALAGIVAAVTRATGSRRRRGGRQRRWRRRGAA